ncbi:hypothetical protein JNB_07354 [Janibacter sp. HTCC2649]|uniref:hypothetical protein n=1 Tax=Janibacter sp. HTCC2649 TaxID=313589 RepID=UPI0000670A83|nr:hypothetical protein [Janibacter sp. HTCC2649]EAP99968.1 hypothetical protein JNB_07354 [Janibacter sp. HTCC2649]
MVQPAIVVDGRGGLPDEIARQLRLAGTDRVHGGPYAADAAEALLGLSPRERPAAVILVDNHTVTVEATAPWQRAGVIHLPVTCDGARSVVGPLIIPGQGACWRCHALTAHDLEAVGALPAVGRFTLDPVALPPGGLGVLTAAITASVTLAAVAGATRLSGVSTELEVEGPSVAHRHWGRHPMCTDCSASGSAAWPPNTQDTMAG